MCELTTLKEKYNRIREEEKEKLRRFLINKGIENIPKRSNSGKGKSAYTSGKRLSLPYDLSNWKYIELTFQEVNFFISFQTFDMDPSSKNIHTLMDRIGISFYTGRYDPNIVFSNMKITNIELPFDNKKMEQIYQIIINIAPHIKALEDVYDTYGLV